MGDSTDARGAHGVGVTVREVSRHGVGVGVGVVCVVFFHVGGSRRKQGDRPQGEVGGGLELGTCLYFNVAFINSCSDFQVVMPIGRIGTGILNDIDFRSCMKVCTVLEGHPTFSLRTDVVFCMCDVPIWTHSDG